MATSLVSTGVQFPDSTTQTTAVNLASPAAIGSTTANTASFTTVSASSTVTLSGGTANGVAYLNGSKVVTSGSALQFDGSSTLTMGTNTVVRNSSGFNIFRADTDLYLDAKQGGVSGDILFRQASTEQMRLTSTGLGIGTSSPTTKLDVVGAETLRGAALAGAILVITPDASSGANGVVYNTSFATGGNGPHIWQIGASEQMRLTSTGLGIGTSSPTSKLTVKVATNGNLSVLTPNSGTGTRIWSLNDAGSVFQRLELQGNPVVFPLTTGADGMYFDASSGNLGLGVTPSAWLSGYKAFDVNSTSSFVGTGSATWLFNNWYVNSAGQNTYKTTAAAAAYYVGAGVHYWYNAPSGTAGNAISFTQAMTLDASGVLTVPAGGVIQGITVGRGAGAVATNTAVGASALAANTSGVENTAIGVFALTLNTTGFANVALGDNTLRTNLIGEQNTALGHNVLYVNTGSFNTGAGSNTLRFNTTGANNTAFGFNSLFSNTTASNNTAVGYQAGYSNTTGGGGTFVGRLAGYTSNADGNTAVGNAALYLTTTGASNVAIGENALRSNTTASNNTAVGYQAGYSANGANAVSIGYQAGYQNLTGNYSVSVGYQALYGGASADIDRAVAIGAFALKSDTTGDYNVAVGYEALNSNTTASNNTAVGYQAGYGNTTGTITALGYQAGYGQTTGTLNTFLGQEQGSFNAVTGASNSGVGYRALLKISSGSYNTAIGQEALRENTTASSNTAVGYQAGYSNTTGARNIVMGYQAGYTNTVGSYNTFIGDQAGYTSNVALANNTCVGSAAGYSLTTGTTNTFIGANSTVGAAGYYVTTGSKNTIIGGYNGNQGGLDIRTASNYIVLSDGDGNPRGFFDNSGTFRFNSYTGWTIGDAGYVCAVSAGKFYMLNGSGGVELGSGATSWASHSDERNKDIIEPITDAMSKVNTLRSVIGKYKTDAEGTRRAFLIAQDVEKILPEAVDTSEEDKWTLRYTDTIPLLVKAIQELKAEFDAYKASHP
jgi:hypothetical protein